MAEMPWRVPLSDVAVDEELVAAVTETVSTGWWSMGPRVAELEREFAEVAGTKHALAVANGTAALHIALLAADVGPGDEVVLPSLNFVAAANVIAHAGARAVFCDVNGAEDLNLDPDDLAAAIGPQTNALIALHYGGHPCDMDAVHEIAERRSVTIIEDAAHAPGASLGGRPCGSMSRIACFSFFSNKNLPVGEGGMVVTDDDELAERLRLLRSHGMTTLTWDRHRGHAHSYDVVLKGFNYRLDELRAAMALVQLRRLREGNEARAAHVAHYRERLDGVEGIVMPFGDTRPDAISSHHLAVVVLPEGVQRDAVRTALAEARIQTSVHYPPIHEFTTYAEDSPRQLPRTEDLALRILTLPLYPHMDDEQVDLVADTLLESLRAGQRVASDAAV